MKTSELEKRFIEAGTPVRLARMLAQRFAFMHEEIERQNKVIEELSQQSATLAHEGRTEQVIL